MLISQTPVLFSFEEGYLITNLINCPEIINVCRAKCDNGFKHRKLPYMLC